MVRASLTAWRSAALFAQLSLLATLSPFASARAQQLVPTPGAPAAPAACQPEWIPTFGGELGLNAPATALAVYDDGSGPALYATGMFTTAGGLPANHIARFDGTHWSALGSGLQQGSGNSLAVYDDGSGPALYVSGDFATAGGVSASYIARWNGTSWSAVGSGLDYIASAMAVFNDGSGPALYAGGTFLAAGGVPASYIAKWNGTSWSALGSGVDSVVLTLAVFDDGGGPALYAGGDFTHAGGLAASHIARWKGVGWSAVGSGTNADIEALAVFNDGSGPALYAGGTFTSAGALGANCIARWNGLSWSALGSGMDAAVHALCVHDDGSGPALYAGGAFQTAGGGAFAHVARWRSSGWSGCGYTAFASEVSAFAVFDPGSGRELCAAGDFSIQVYGGGMVQTHNMAQWDGTAWKPLGRGMTGRVESLASFDDGNGPALYAGGAFMTSDPVPVWSLGRWNGSGWSTLPGGPDWHVWALANFDDGSGAALYAGGGFLIHIGTTITTGIARWNGTSWSALGAGLNPEVWALQAFDDGTGPALYAGGAFWNSGSTGLGRVGRWNGTSWSALGSGVSDTIYALSVFDDGQGPALYAGGAFTIAGGAPAAHIARWNGTSWSALGSGVDGTVLALMVFDDGSGPALYAGGGFTHAGAVVALHAAKWDGTSWSALGGGTNGQVQTLAVFDDGTGNALYAGGAFADAGSQPAQGIARWDGSNWSALGGGMTNANALTVFDDGHGPALVAGSWYGHAIDSGDGLVARYANPQGCGTPGTSVCEPGVGGVVGCPCANPPAGLDRGCNNSSFTGGASLAASGIARVSYDTVVFTSGDERATATSIVLQGDGLSASGLVFGQGVRCVAGNLKRMYIQSAVNGSIRAPRTGEMHVYARSAALSDTIAPGTHRYYGVYYRDPIVLGGCSASSTFSITQQLDLLWAN